MMMPLRAGSHTGACFLTDASSSTSDRIASPIIGTSVMIRELICKKTGWSPQ